MVSRRLLLAGLGTGLAGLAMAGSALALTLDEARAAGQVGEMPNGYVGVVESGPGVQDLVDSINRRRRARYEELAQENNQPLAAIEQLAGMQLIEQASPGEYVMNASGGWVRK